VSVVIACLNEDLTIAHCARRAREAISASGLVGEVIVVDNGSTDQSVPRALEAGAKVVEEPRKGYGNAFLRGLSVARGRAILLGDGDATYDFAELPRFLALLNDGADVVIGSRLKGRILPGAMPWHHRWIGTPLLTAALNTLFRVGVSDAHCGLRMVRRWVLPRLDLQAPGMEFASEMLVKASLAGLRVVETPITYAPRPAGASSKLRSVPDGLRHLRFLLAWAPSPVLLPALALIAWGVALLTGVRPDTVLAGGALLTTGGVVGLSSLWLLLYRWVAFDRAESGRLMRWLRSPLPAAGAMVFAFGAATLAFALAEVTRAHLASTDGRAELVLSSVAVVTACGALVVLSLRRRLRPGSPVP
jgi:Glycosyl transferase family 2